MPLRPSKLRLKVRSETPLLLGENPIPMQGPQADSRIRAPAPIRSASAPFSASMVSTCLEPGLIESSTSGATVLPRSIAATVIRSAREELVQLPMQT